MTFGASIFTLSVSSLAGTSIAVCRGMTRNPERTMDAATTKHPFHHDFFPEQDRLRIDKMAKAFDFVCPRKNAERLVAKGLVKAEDIARVTWRDTICALVLEEELRAAGLTIEDVKDSVIFYTATEATVTASNIGSRAGETFNQPAPGYLVQSVGYRAGPAGP